MLQFIASLLLIVYTLTIETNLLQQKVELAFSKWDWGVHLTSKNIFSTLMKL